MFDLTLCAFIHHSALPSKWPVPPSSMDKPELMDTSSNLMHIIQGPFSNAPLPRTLFDPVPVMQVGNTESCLPCMFNILFAFKIILPLDESLLESNFHGHQHLNSSRICSFMIKSILYHLDLSFPCILNAKQSNLTRTWLADYRP